MWHKSPAMCRQLKRVKSDTMSEEHILSHTVAQVSPNMAAVVHSRSWAILAPANVNIVIRDRGIVWDFG